ncbi:MAG: glutaredoxin family protein [Granulosicoccus sp.]
MYENGGSDTIAAVDLTLFFREGCHLCEDLEQQLEQLLPRGSYRLLRVDIDDNPALRERYNERVPVLAHDEIELCHHFLDLQAVRQVLASYNTSD